MIGTRFMFNFEEYQVWDKYGANDLTGEITWMCRGLYADQTVYLTTEGIEESTILHREQ